jgi:hypothetical protein
MARAALTNRTMRDPDSVKTQVNSHKTTIDSMEAGTSFKQLACTAGNGAGARTLTGAAVGDRVIGVWNHTDGTINTVDFEGAITVVNQIQQLTTNLASDVCVVLLLKPVS